MRSGLTTAFRKLVGDEQRFAACMFIVATMSMIALTLSNVLWGLFYDTDHFGDTLFMLGSSWRIVQGLTPVLDFGHFYGGVLDQGIAASMLVFGLDVFSFERFTLFLFLLFATVSWAVLAGRMSRTGWTALVLIFAVLALTRYPLEINAPVIRLLSTHSFLYNRVGFAILLIAGLFVALRGKNPRSDVIPGLLVGLLLVLAALTKPTFAVLILGTLLGLVVQFRWHGFASVLAGTAIMILLADPSLGRWLGSIAYIEAQVGGDPSTGVVALLRKSVQLPLSQPIATAIALVAIGLLLFERSNFAPVLSLLMMAAAGVGMASTMGGNGDLGQLAYPIAILIALAAAEIARSGAARHARLLRVFSNVLVLALAFPHLLNLAGTILEGAAQRDRLLVTTGPYQRYLSLPEGADQEGTVSQYAMFADGINSLQNLGDPSQWGIVADHGITFEHAVLGRPVPGYPLWQRPTAPELADGKPIAPEADVVMLGRSSKKDEVGSILRGKLDADFVLCATSAHWEIHARRSSNILCPLD